MPENRNCWTIRFTDYDPDDELRREALLALGNGVFSWRASAPEAAGDSADSPRRHYAGFYRAGWYDEASREVNGETVRVASLVNLPDPFGLSFSVDGNRWFSLDEQPLDHYQQQLWLDEGVLRRDLHFEFAGHRWQLTESRFVSMAEPAVLLLRWELQVPEGIRSLWLRSSLDGAVSNSLVTKNRPYEGARLCNVEFDDFPDGRAALSATLQDPARRVALALQTSVAGIQARWRPRLDGDRLLQETQIIPDTSRRLCVEKRVTVQFDTDVPSEPSVARTKALQALPKADSSALETSHRKAWKVLWQRLSLTIGDDELERRLRLHVFHLLEAVSPLSLGHDQGFPPRGWQEGYYGQVFWDELFAYPFLVTHFPELALNLLRYRHRRLDTARNRARRAGLRGALFPWRSAASGEEETPPYQLNPLSGRWMEDHTRLEYHVGSAIAHDAWLLYLATDDKQLLANEAGELILEIARFWASVVQHDESCDRYMIRGVIGPDEYHHRYPDALQPGLDNNAYTNLMACWTLRLGLQLLQVLLDEQAAALTQRLQITPDELAHWERVSQRMYLPFNRDGTLSQFDGFEELEPAPKAWLEGDRPRLDWLLEAKGDHSDRYQLSKQADVLTLLHLFPPRHLQAMIEECGYRFDCEAIKRTAHYHLSHITHESSLSKMVCAGALAHIDPEKSWEYFLQSSAVDLCAPADSGTLEGVHLGAKAGSLDVLQRHYLGAWLALDGLHLFPSPPPALDNVQSDLWYRGARLTLTLQGSELSVESESTNPVTIPVHHPSGAAQLAPGQRLVVRCTRS